MPPISLYDKFIKFVLQDDKGTELDSIPVSRGLGLKQVLDELRGAFNTPPNTTIPLFKRELFIEDALDDHLVYVTDSAWRWIRGKRDIYQLIVQANPTTAAAPVRLRQQHSPTHSPSPPSSSSQDSGSVSSMRANALKFHSGRARVCEKKPPKGDRTNEHRNQIMESIERRGIQPNTIAHDEPRRSEGGSRKKTGRGNARGKRDPRVIAQKQMRMRNLIRQGYSCLRCLRYGDKYKYTRAHPMTTRCDACGEKGRKYSTYSMS